MNCTPLKKAPWPAVVGPVVIAVMDGIGLGDGSEADAVAAARTPNLDRYARGSLATKLQAHGTFVGMPTDEDMGNSEVGHNALGAGRVFAQGARLVQEAVTSGRLFEGPTWLHILAHCRRNRSTLHLLGLLSDGNVHSHIDHLIALVQRAAAGGIDNIRIHILLDGRDVAKTSALTYVDKLEGALQAMPAHRGRACIASGGGRMQITMDRYGADWPMVERGWKTHVLGQGPQFASARAAIETFRAQSPGIIDQDLPAFVIAEGGVPVGRVRDGDAMIAFNFRGDRMLEWVQTFEDESFDAFDRGKRPDVFFVGMTLYDGDSRRPQHYLVDAPLIRCTLSELLCEAGVPQLAVSETQKFGHVTYFWNGNRAEKFDARLETYIEVPSLNTPFDAQPQMRAQEITDAVLKELGRRPYGLCRLNYPNGDMVGHTGNFAATVRAVEVVDGCLGQLEKAVLAAQGALVVTADHGNADDMAERDKKTGKPLHDATGRLVAKTSHSLNPVPLYVLLPPEVNREFELNPIDGGLGNVAATATTLLGFETPHEFLPSLLRRRR